MTNPTKKKFSSAYPATSSAPAAATRSGCATSSIGGGFDTDKPQPTTCGEGVGVRGSDTLNPEEIEMAVERDFRRHGSRVDGGMVVATIATLLMVFAAGAFVGWLLWA